MRANLILVACACALVSVTAQGQDHPGPGTRLTLVPADASSAGGGASEDEKDNQAELAKKLNNPVANLISVPIQNNWDFGIGPANAMRYTANIQPVIPISVAKDWNVIVRTIMPVIDAPSPAPGDGASIKIGRAHV